MEITRVPTGKTNFGLVGPTALLTKAPSLGTTPAPQHSYSPVSSKGAFFPGYPLPRFTGQINKDFSVEIRPDLPITSHSIFVALREMLFKSLVKTAENDNSSLKFFLDAGQVVDFPFTNQAALADNFRYLERDVDVVINAFCHVDGIKALLSATGKRYMNAGAELYLGPLMAYKPDANSEESKALYRLYLDYVQDLRALVIEKTGEDNPQKLKDDFNSSKPINSLQALWYGKNGLVDAALVGPDKVVTRADLQRYYEAKGFKEEDIEKFNAERDNIYKVTPSQTLAQFSPGSVPAKPRTGYESMASRFERQKRIQQELLNPRVKATETTKSTGPSFYYTALDSGKLVKLQKLPRSTDLSDAVVSTQMSVANLPEKLPSTLYRDTVFFNSGFRSDTISQLTQALELIDEKKAEEKEKQGIKQPSNIAIVENSPGGWISMARELKDRIDSLQTPVDVIAQGMGASCGALLLCSATGNRFATPNARILIHLAASGGGGEIRMDEFEESNESLDQSTLDCANIISKATDKDKDDVYEDMRRVDVWFTPLEALFYGSKGLIDAILVGADKIITRETVNSYLLELFNNDQKAVDEYVEKKISEKIDPDRGRRKSNDNSKQSDPFNDPLKTIQQLASKASSMSEIKRFKASLPSKVKTIDYYHVLPEMSMLMEDEE